MTPSAAHAAIRFGLGARPGDAPPDDPRAWLESQIAPLPEAAGPTPDEIRAALDARRRDPASNPIRAFNRDEALAWATRLLTTGRPFAERWAEFWSNHLAISRRGAIATAFGGHYHRQGIRPHVFGRFDAMLLAAYREPAMLAYLDQAGAVGPGSPGGRRRNAGLNENLARECLELHSITPAGGYSQADVGALARILTGWSIGRGPEASEPTGFMFRPLAHEPGPKTLLGQEFPEGEAGGVAALALLANHPATHRALAAKLARHFIRDDPPAGSVARIEAALRDSGGDLAAAARAVIAEPLAWEPLTKLRSAQDYVLAVMRGLGLGAAAAPALLAALARLGQPLWLAPAPIGWPDDAAAWAVPEQLMRRVEWANEMASRAAFTPALTESFLGPLAPAETIDAARRAGSAREAVLLLLACPEAHRR
ncbi:DUF1800 domain-containing protein [Roseococcus sp. SDR]|uniref:DUF1800 domain-containing protein n=1 Tax=Roseococcus sp. SDR TaxID=2835532 RepID=UPI001BD0DF1F|nr:DUF1800 domain-containing protein [Roseococcus sp. SDR]MBS7790935.1 DUF1800 domain-containing protein [Roseococcus sp. SDR]MBV1846249.1 DUF1800 domain-containing protein [Roseococcus sp. SDR]